MKSKKICAAVLAAALTVGTASVSAISPVAFAGAGPAASAAATDVTIAKNATTASITVAHDATDFTLKISGLNGYSVDSTVGANKVNVTAGAKGGTTPAVSGDNLEITVDVSDIAAGASGSKTVSYQLPAAGGSAWDTAIDVTIAVTKEDAPVVEDTVTVYAPTGITATATGATGVYDADTGKLTITLAKTAAEYAAETTVADIDVTVKIAGVAGDVTTVGSEAEGIIDIGGTAYVASSADTATVTVENIKEGTAAANPASISYNVSKKTVKGDGSGTTWASEAKTITVEVEYKAAENPPVDSGSDSDDSSTTPDTPSEPAHTPVTPTEIPTTSDTTTTSSTTSSTTSDNTSSAATVDPVDTKVEADVKVGETVTVKSEDLGGDVTVATDKEDTALEGAKLEVAATNKKEDTTKKLDAAVGENATAEVKAVVEAAVKAVEDGNAVTLDISFTKDGADVQPGKAVTITAPVPAALKGAEKLYVYHATDKGLENVTDKCTYDKDKGTIAITNDKFSPYIVSKVEIKAEAATSSTPASSTGTSTSNPSTGVAVAVAPIVLAGAAVAVFSIKRRK